MFRNVFRYWMSSLCFETVYRYCLKGVLLKIVKIQQPLSQGSSKKRKSDNDDKHGHGQEKWRPTTYVEGTKFEYLNVRLTEIECSASEKSDSRSVEVFKQKTLSNFRFSEFWFSRFRNCAIRMSDSWCYTVRWSRFRMLKFPNHDFLTLDTPTCYCSKCRIYQIQISRISDFWISTFRNPDLFSSVIRNSKFRSSGCQVYSRCPVASWQGHLASNPECVVLVLRALVQTRVECTQQNTLLFTVLARQRWTNSHMLPL